MNQLKWLGIIYDTMRACVQDDDDDDDEDDEEERPVKTPEKKDKKKDKKDSDKKSKPEPEAPKEKQLPALSLEDSKVLKEALKKCVFKGVVVGLVKSVSKHPKANDLNVLVITDGMIHDIPACAPQIENYVVCTCSLSR